MHYAEVMNKSQVSFLRQSVEESILFDYYKKTKPVGKSQQKFLLFLTFSSPIIKDAIWNRKSNNIETRAATNSAMSGTSYWTSQQAVTYLKMDSTRVLGSWNFRKTLKTLIRISGRGHRKIDQYEYWTTVCVNSNIYTNTQKAQLLQNHMDLHVWPYMQPYLYTVSWLALGFWAYWNTLFYIVLWYWTTRL